MKRTPTPSSANPITHPFTDAQGNAGQPGDDDFFLPDLCNNESVLMIVIVAELFAILLVLVKTGLLAFDWLQLAIISLYLQWVSLTSAFLLCRLRPWLLQQPGSRGVWFSYMIVPLNTWVFSTLATAFVERPEEPLLAIWFSDNVLRDVAVSAIVGGMVFRYFYLHAQLLARRQSELKHRIQALQSRIHPHFLFNSMNSIASLIAIDPTAAEEAVEDLSALFRASLNDAGNQVPLQVELDLCKRYLRIEQLRLGKRMQVRWVSHNVPENIQIPLLTLQPLLENAVLHGIQPLPEGGEILIESAYAHGIFEIKVVNPYNPSSANDLNGKREHQHEKGNRMALENIRNRLRVLYGDRAKLTSYAEQNRYICHLSYPYAITDRTVAGVRLT